ncbi:MAG TPA: hypothetical protein VN040_16825 [Pseudosphingobacterium sp.]|nr:hypothetical protein [Pseudosphingobacterium sp.]
MIASNDNKWFKIGITIIVVIISVGIVKVLVPNLFLQKVEGTVVEIKQKYSEEGDEKLLLLTLKKQPTFSHLYVNKDYLPSPHINELKEYNYLITYVSKLGDKKTFYGLALTNGETIQSKRWDIINAYLNDPMVVFILIVVPIALYSIYRKTLLKGRQHIIILFIYSFILAYAWGRLHFFLMIVLILGLIRLGKNLSDQRKGQVANESVDIPTQT